MGQSDWWGYVGRVWDSLDNSDCDCGAADGSRCHTVHRGNPTGHAVGCPVYVRWRDSNETTPRGRNEAS